MSAICGKTRILITEHPMKFSHLILLHPMFHIRSTGRICLPPRDSWWHCMYLPPLLRTRTSCYARFTGQARRWMLESGGTLLKKSEVAATTNSKEPLRNRWHFEIRLAKGEISQQENEKSCT